MLMLHVRDCTGLLHNGDACPFPWCGAVKHLMYHLVSCTGGGRCAVCNPVVDDDGGDGTCPTAPLLGDGLRTLAGLNGHRRARWVERRRAESARAAARAGPGANVPAPAASAGSGSDGAAEEHPAAGSGAQFDDHDHHHVSFAAEPDPSQSPGYHDGEDDGDGDHEEDEDEDQEEEDHLEESDMSALPPEPVLGDHGPSDPPHHDGDGHDDDDGERGHDHHDDHHGHPLTKSLSQLSTLSSSHFGRSPALSASHALPSPALSALAGLPSSLSVSGLPTLEEAAMELGDMGLSSSDLLAGVESSGKLAHLG